MKTIEIYAKHSDLIDYSIYEDGKLIMEKEGESPYPLSICSSYDDMLIKIDLETGKIINWDKIKAKQFLENIDKDEIDEEDEDANFDLSKAQKEYDDKLPLRIAKRAEDKEFYASKLVEVQKEMLQYKEKFSKISLGEEIESIYRMLDSNIDDSNEFCLYRLLSVSVQLMKNDIPLFFNKETRLVKVNSSDAKRAREILTNLGAYEFKFLRRENDIHSMIWNN